MFKLIYKFTVSLVLLALLLAVWTSIVVINNGTTSYEIKGLISNMYSNQRDFVVNTSKLTKLLISDAQVRISQRSKKLESYNELDSNQESTEPEESKESIKIYSNEQTSEVSQFEDNGNNPLGIYIEPSKMNTEFEDLSLDDLKENQLSFKNID
tara:strand:- start:289 stop:750 length:462 start_codon:yes stop_codon:yes gene_type:complete